MNTETQKPLFRRRGRVGMSVLEVPEKSTVYVKIVNHGIFDTRDGRKIPYFDVTNLHTGEEQRMWIDGGLKGQLSGLGGVEKAVGMSLEITKTGQTEIEHETQGRVRVNTYDVFELDA